MEDHKVQRGLMVVLKGLSCEGQHGLRDWKPSGITNISKDTSELGSQKLNLDQRGQSRTLLGQPTGLSQCSTGYMAWKGEKDTNTAPLAQKLSCRSLFTLVRYTQSSTNFCWIELMDCLVSFCFKLKWHSNHPPIFFHLHLKWYVKKQCWFWIDEESLRGDIFKLQTEQLRN